MRSSNRALIAALLAASIGVSGMADASPAPDPETAISYGRYQDTGLSSWYGEELSGNRTASGERFDPNAMTAAHRSLPLGSFVEVTAVETGRSVIVRINDRGPGRRDRIIDLSRGAAKLLGTDRRSVANVRVRAILPSEGDAAILRAGRSIAPRMPSFVQAAASHMPDAVTPDIVAGRFYAVQVATFSNEDRARALAKTLDARVVSGGGFWRVRLGPFKGAKELQRARDAVAERGYGDARILPED